MNSIVLGIIFKVNQTFIDINSTLNSWKIYEKKKTIKNKLNQMENNRIRVKTFFSFSQRAKINKKKVESFVYERPFLLLTFTWICYSYSIIMMVWGLKRIVLKEGNFDYTFCCIALLEICCFVIEERIFSSTFKVFFVCSFFMKNHISCWHLQKIVCHLLNDTY